MQTLFDDYITTYMWIILWYQLLVLEDEDTQFSCILGWAIYFNSIWNMYAVEGA